MCRIFCSSHIQTYTFKYLNEPKIRCLRYNFFIGLINMVTISEQLQSLNKIADMDERDTSEFRQIRRQITQGVLFFFPQQHLLWYDNMVSNIARMFLRWNFNPSSIDLKAFKTMFEVCEFQFRCRDIDRHLTDQIVSVKFQKLKNDEQRLIGVKYGCDRLFSLKVQRLMPNNDFQVQQRLSQITEQMKKDQKSRKNRRKHLFENNQVPENPQTSTSQLFMVLRSSKHQPMCTQYLLINRKLLNEMGKRNYTIWVYHEQANYLIKKDTQDVMNVKQGRLIRSIKRLLRSDRQLEE